MRMRSPGQERELQARNDEAADQIASLQSDLKAATAALADYKARRARRVMIESRRGRASIPKGVPAGRSSRSDWLESNIGCMQLTFALQDALEAHAEKQLHNKDTLIELYKCASEKAAAKIADMQLLVENSQELLRQAHAQVLQHCMN